MPSQRPASGVVRRRLITGATVCSMERSRRHWRQVWHAAGTCRDHLLQRSLNQDDAYRRASRFLNALHLFAVDPRIHVGFWLTEFSRVTESSGGNVPADVGQVGDSDAKICIAGSACPRDGVELVDLLLLGENDHSGGRPQELKLSRRDDRLIGRSNRENNQARKLVDGPQHRSPRPRNLG